MQIRNIRRVIMPTNHKISFCGDNCSECPRYIATVTNDTKALTDLAELWFRLGFRPNVVNPEEIRCNGCNRNMPCSNGINDCRHLDNINNCGECDYFPCGKIDAVFQKTDKINETCMVKCTESEYQILQRAFLMKRQILTEINKNHRIENK
jgi:hypothetical protein